MNTKNTLICEHLGAKGLTKHLFLVKAKLKKPNELIHCLCEQTIGSFVTWDLIVHTFREKVWEVKTSFQGQTRKATRMYLVKTDASWFWKKTVSVKKF